MRVKDSEDVIRQGLLGLDWYRYLGAMWIVFGEIQAQYRVQAQSQGYIHAGEDPLMDEVLNIVRDVAASGILPAQTSERAAALWRRWGALISQQEDPDSLERGQWSTWLIFSRLIGEIAGSRRNYFARGMLITTIKDLWMGAPSPESGRAIWINNPNQEIPNDSALANILRRVERIVAGIADTTELDPWKVRTLVLG